MDNRLILSFIMQVSELVEVLRRDEALLDHTKEHLAGISYRLDETLALMKKELGYTF